MCENIFPFAVSYVFQCQVDFLSEVAKAYHQDDAWFYWDAIATDFYAMSGLRCIQDHPHVQSPTAQNS